MTNVVTSHSTKCEVQRNFILRVVPAAACCLIVGKFVWSSEGISGEQAGHSPERGRHLLQNVISKEDAAELTELAKQATVVGDGYQGRDHALSPREIFSGATPSAIAKWAILRPDADGQRQRALERTRLLVNYAALGKNLTEDAFQLRRGSLGFDFVHLTCRRHEDGSREAVKDSHPVHADNCFFKGSECVRASPMYYWRTHSTIISLNSADDGDFEGGDFFYEAFPRESSSARARVPPKVGQAATFTAGVENVHGVEAVRRGSRCQLSLWMTDDLRRAGHANELQAAEKLLNGKLPDKSAMAAAVASDTDFGLMCQRAVESTADFVASTDAKGAGNVADLELPGENRTLSVEVLSDLPRPQISLIRGLLTKDEISHLVQKASPHFKAAVVFEGNSLTTAKYRTSSTSWLRDDEGDTVVTRVLERIKLVTGLSLASAEELQVARYLDKDHGRYEPHFDWGTIGKVTREFSRKRGEPVGARIATLLIYLSDVESGGDTAFQKVNVSVAPRVGNAVLFYNLLPSGSGDEELLHGGCPVLQGEKVIMTKWVHELGNEGVFDAGSGQKRFARDWKAVAENLRGTRVNEEPFMVGRQCESWRAANECISNPLKMARACPGSCEENLVSSKVRQRQIFESVITDEVAKDVLDLAASSAMVAGDGYNGSKRPLSMREIYTGVRPVDAARWAVSHTDAAAKTKAIRWVQAYLSAIAKMQEVVGEAEGSWPVLLENVQLACRTASQRPRVEDAADAFSMSDRPISAGSDLLIATMTLSEAHAKCLSLPACGGFTFNDVPSERPVEIYFKSKQDLYEPGTGWTSYLKRLEPIIADSHPPHADNCAKQRSHCVPSQNRWQSHSATLYLHGEESGDFSGGSFFYSPTWDSPISKRLHVTPKMGRMLAFGTGESNIHGVEEVTSGSRCAITAWFTKDPKRMEASRGLKAAQEILGAASLH